jgi:hypothetical protein
MRYAGSNYMPRILLYFGSHLLFILCLELAEMRFGGAEVGP